MSISENILNKLKEDMENANIEQRKLYAKYRSLMNKLQNYDKYRSKVSYSKLVQQIEEVEKELEQLGLYPHNYMDKYILKGSSPKREKEWKDSKEFMKKELGGI